MINSQPETGINRVLEGYFLFYFPGGGQPPDPPDGAWGGIPTPQPPQRLAPQNPTSRTATE